MKSLNLFMIFLIFSSTIFAQASKTVSFLSLDSVLITADLYVTKPDSAPFILFFHQAGWSRGEYIEIAPKMNALGFNAMAVDQRSGAKVNKVINQTHIDAEKKEKSTQFLDALPDMKAAILYVKKNYPHAPLILWGSSYSSALVLKIAGDNPQNISAVLAFSPGEYYVRFGKPDDFIASSAKNIVCPVFISSAKNEAGRWKAIFGAIPGDNKIGFIPKSAGNHGSRALWESKSGNMEYWTAVEAFLKPFEK